jgi:hypothetical protein
MTTYTIYLGATPIATTDGTEYTYAVWRKTVELADLINSSACLVWDDTGEVVEEFDPEELEYTEPDEDEDFDGFVDYSDESGFDPYMGCYTGDC